MQINFFTSPEDEKELFDFIKKKEGYLIADFWKPETNMISVLSKSDLEDLNNYREVGILNIDILPYSDSQIKVSDLRNEKGFPLVEVIEFTRSYSKDGIFYPGGLWINGLKPETEKLYKSISAFIRRKFTNKNGWYWGPTANEYCSTNNLSKAASAYK